MALVDLYEPLADRSALPAPSPVCHVATNTSRWREDSDKYADFVLPSSDVPSESEEEVDSDGSLFRAASSDTPAGGNDELLWMP
jgi:hypothetical protein